MAMTRRAALGALAALPVIAAPVLATSVEDRLTRIVFEIDFAEDDENAKAPRIHSLLRWIADHGYDTPPQSVNWQGATMRWRRIYVKKEG